MDLGLLASSLPRVSIIVPVRNGAATIASCLESLLAQDYPADRFEIVVVENDSSDDTAEVVARHPVRLLRTRTPGIANARNLGLAASDADVVAHTDTDCLADRRWLTELLKPYPDPAVGGVGGAIVPHAGQDGNAVELFSRRHPPLVNFISGRDEFLPHLYGANVSYRRGLLDQIGGYRRDLIASEDVDASWRLQLQTGARLEYAPDAIIFHRDRSTAAGLMKQYRRYGYGEIVLDTLYGGHPGYPRDRGYQLRRLLGQAAALPRYTLSALVRAARLATGRTSRAEAMLPLLWLLVESSSIRGKLDGLLASRLMTDARAAVRGDADALTNRLF